MIDILMATYNGEKYLSEQINSILIQTNEDWNLIIQDDCSTDRTVEIIEEYVNKFPEKIRLFRRATPSGSAKNNFFSMLSLSDSDYCMTCDQDDVWLPEKIELTLRGMHGVEALYGMNVPLLVHTDLKVTDEQLTTMADSLFKLQGLSNKRDEFPQLLVQNIVSGCTVMVNKSLLDKVEAIPEFAIMHDWWLALVAAAFGHILFINEPTILYRQHCSNQVGAKNTHSFPYNWARFSDQLGVKTALRDAYAQATEFLSTYGELVEGEPRKMLEAYSTLAEQPKVKRIRILMKYHLIKYGVIRKIAQLIFV